MLDRSPLNRPPGLFILPLLFLSGCWNASESEKNAPTEVRCKTIQDRQLEASDSGVPRKKLARAAAFEILFPGDEDQYSALNKMALIGVWAVSSVEGMLPVTGAYIIEPRSGGDALLMLPPVSPKQMKVIKKHEDSSEVARRFGNYSQELFFFIPMRILAAKGEFGLKFGEGGEHLPVAKMPIPFELPFFKSDPFPYEDSDKAPDLALAEGLIQKYFCHTF